MEETSPTNPCSDLSLLRGQNRCSSQSTRNPGGRTRPASVRPIS